MLKRNLLSNDSFSFVIIDQGLNEIFERLLRKLTSPGKLLSSVQPGQILLGWKNINIIKKVLMEKRVIVLESAILSLKIILKLFLKVCHNCRELAHEFLKNPIKVTIGSDDLAAGTRIKQIVEVIEDRAREQKLDKLLKVCLFR